MSLPVSPLIDNVPYALPSRTTSNVCSLPFVFHPSSPSIMGIHLITTVYPEDRKCELCQPSVQFDGNAASDSSTRRPVWEILFHRNEGKECEQEAEDDYAWYYKHPERYIYRPRRSRQRPRRRIDQPLRVYYSQPVQRVPPVSNHASGSSECGSTSLLIRSM